MKPLEIPKGAHVYIGAPAQPLPDAIVTGLRSLVPLSRSQTQGVLDTVGPQLMWSNLLIVMSLV